MARLIWFHCPATPEKGKDLDSAEEVKMLIEKKSAINLITVRSVLPLHLVKISDGKTAFVPLGICHRN